ncbi:hypothetical protein BDV93DRAFT_560745 [Ceratobasidium sp. AG-I]|nr:hypothetical protein BDV93DRAFT_560745 [Ceratobasidium sp. AG-I]
MLSIRELHQGVHSLIFHILLPLLILLPRICIAQSAHSYGIPAAARKKSQTISIKNRRTRARKAAASASVSATPSDALSTATSAVPTDDEGDAPRQTMQTMQGPAQEKNSSTAAEAMEIDEHGPLSAAEEPSQSLVYSQAGLSYKVSRTELAKRLTSLVNYDIGDLTMQQMFDIIETICASEAATLDFEEQYPAINPGSPSLEVNGGGFYHQAVNTTIAAKRTRTPALPDPKSSQKRPRHDAPDNTDTEPETEPETQVAPIHLPRLSAHNPTPGPPHHKSSSCTSSVSALPPPQVKSQPQPRRDAKPTSQWMHASSNSRSYAGSRSLVGSRPNSQLQLGTSTNPSANLQHAKTPLAHPFIPRLDLQHVCSLQSNKHSPSCSESLPQSRQGSGPTFISQPNSNPLPSMLCTSSHSLGGLLLHYGSPGNIHQSSASTQPQIITQSHHGSPPPLSQGAARTQSRVHPSSSSGLESRSGSGPGSTRRRPLPLLDVLHRSALTHARVDTTINAQDRLRRLVGVVIGDQGPNIGHPPSQQLRRGPSSTTARPQPEPSGSAGQSQDAHTTSGVMPDNEEICQAVAACNANKLLRRRKKKPLTTDSEGNERQVVTMAKLELFAATLAYGPYQNRKTYLSWAPLVYELAWYKEFPDLPLEVPGLSVHEVMANNLAAMQCAIKPELRYAIEAELGFKKPVRTLEDRAFNLRLYERYHTNGFHSLRALTRILRKLSDAPYFTPLSVATIAFTLALMQFGVDEWSTGDHVPADLSAGHTPEKYICQLEGLNNFRSTDIDYFNELRDSWYQYSIAYSGAHSSAKAKCHQPVLQPGDFLADCLARQAARASAPDPKTHSGPGNNAQYTSPKPAMQDVELRDEQSKGESGISSHKRQVPNKIEQRTQLHDAHNAQPDGADNSQIHDTRTTPPYHSYNANQDDPRHEEHNRRSSVDSLLDRLVMSPGNSGNPARKYPEIPGPGHQARARAWLFLLGFLRIPTVKRPNARRCPAFCGNTRNPLPAI